MCGGVWPDTTPELFTVMTSYESNPNKAGGGEFGSYLMTRSVVRCVVTSGLRTQPRNKFQGPSHDSHCTHSAVRAHFLKNAIASK